MNRRDFLRPTQIAQAAGQVLGALDDSWATVALPLPDDSLLIRQAQRCMATTFEVVLPFGTPQPRAIGETAFNLLDGLEAQLSVYRESSEVSCLNREAALRPVPVEAGLFALLSLAASLTAQAGGAFDISTGALIEAWGFFRGPRRVPDEAARLAAMERVGMRHVVLDDAAQTVRYLRSGLAINLGSIGKGYALDKVAQTLARDWQLKAVLLHGGFSSVYARGSPSADPRGWPVDVRHPWERERLLARLWLRDRALGTSAATYRYLEQDGRRFGHVLDPRTGWPASGIASASAVAPTAAEADALSTAFFVGGLDLARTLCAARPEIGAVILPEGCSDPVIVGLSPDACSLPTDDRAASIC